MTPLETRIHSLLTGPVVARIRFRFPIVGSQVTIARQTFHRVADALRSGTVNARRAAGFRAGVGAQYLSAANTLEVKGLSGRVDEAMVVHEALHAAYDLKRTGLDANAEEASAFVCAALYCRMTGLARPRWAGATEWKNAGLVADTLLRQYKQGVRGIPMVGAAEWQTLRMTVALHPVYRWETGGLAGLLLGLQYTHDG